MQERYEYDAYGEVAIMDGSYNPRSESLYDNPYYFTGRRIDVLDNGSLKIQYNRNRYYDYYTGRWLTHDPLGITPNPQKPNVFLPEYQYTDGLSLYEYAQSNPVINNDKLGLLTCGYIVWCDTVKRQDWKGDVLRKLGIRHCDLRKRDIGKKSDFVTTHPVWVMAHPESRTLQAGKGKGCQCKCSKCNQIEDCVREIQKKYPTGDVWPNCHTQTKRAIGACCLNSTWEPAFFAF